MCSNCGNLLIDPGEECDDGNILENDGCSSACLVESGFSCSSLTLPSECRPLHPLTIVLAKTECIDNQSLTLSLYFSHPLHLDSKSLSLQISLLITSKFPHLNSPHCFRNSLFLSQHPLLSSRFLSALTPFPPLPLLTLLK